jgi:hypothetical protein
MLPAMARGIAAAPRRGAEEDDGMSDDAAASNGGWGKRGPAIPGRQVEFEVQAYYDKHWLTEGHFEHEKEAIAFAKSLFADEKVEEVKITRFRAMVGGGLSLKKEIFSEKRAVKPKKAITLSGKITEGRVCTTMQEFMGLGSRIVMNRVLREFLDHMVITPTELLHNFSYQKKLDSLGLIDACVSQLAQAQSAAGQGDVKSRLDALYKLVEQVRYKAQETMSERRRMPVLAEKEYARFCERIDAQYPPDDRDYMIKTGLTNYLNGSPSLAEKLERIAGLVTDDVDNAKVAHLDDMIADLLGAGSLVQDMLGQQPSLGAALGLLADLVLGRLNIEKTKSATAQLQLIHRLLNGRGMAGSKAVLLERLKRETGSAKPLCRSPNPVHERDELNKLDAKLKDAQGKYVLGADFEQMITKRSQAIRRTQLQSLGIAT